MMATFCFCTGGGAVNECKALTKPFGASRCCILCRFKNRMLRRWGGVFVYLVHASDVFLVLLVKPLGLCCIEGSCNEG